MQILRTVDARFPRQLQNTCQTGSAQLQHRRTLAVHHVNGACKPFKMFISQHTCSELRPQLMLARQSEKHQMTNANMVWNAPSKLMSLELLDVM